MYQCYVNNISMLHSNLKDTHFLPGTCDILHKRFVRVWLSRTCSSGVALILSYHEEYALYLPLNSVVLSANYIVHIHIRNSTMFVFFFHTRRSWITSLETLHKQLNPSILGYLKSLDLNLLGTSFWVEL